MTASVSPAEVDYVRQAQGQRRNSLTDLQSDLLRRTPFHKIWLTFVDGAVEDEFHRYKIMSLVEMKLFSKKQQLLLPSYIFSFVGALIVALVIENESVAEFLRIHVGLSAFFIVWTAFLIAFARFYHFEDPDFHARRKWVIPLIAFVFCLAFCIPTLLVLHVSLVQKFSCTSAGECSMGASDVSRLFNSSCSKAFDLDLRGTFHVHFAKFYWLTLPVPLIVYLSVCVIFKLGVSHGMICSLAVFLPHLVVGLSYATQIVDVVLVMFVPCLEFCIVMVVIHTHDQNLRSIFLLDRAQTNKISRVKRDLSIKSNELALKAQKLSAAEAKLANAKLVVDDVMGASVLRQYAIAYSDLTFGDTVGEGSFGTVFKGILRGGTAVAIKTIRVDKVTKDVVHKFKGEITVMAPLKHKNLIHLFGAVWIEGPDKLCLVLEYAPSGNLHDVLMPGRNNQGWECLGFGLAHGISQCFRYLHNGLTEPILHRDLKPANVLADAEMQPKVADFGEARTIDAGKSDQKKDSLLYMTIAGTHLYSQLAPEILEGQPYNKTVDVFSFSLVLLEILLGDTTYVQNRFSNKFAYIRGWRPPIPLQLRELHPSIVSVIERGWAENPASRPGFLSIEPEIAAAKPEATFSLPQKNSQYTGMDVLLSDAERSFITNRFQTSSKRYSAFLSHHKESCASEARMVKRDLDILLGKEAFLDSDNLRDLRSVRGHVRDSDVLVLFQSKEVLCRPWCLLEIYTAVTEGIPIIAINCVGKAYNFADATDFLLHLETNLKTTSPGALRVLEEEGGDPLRIAHTLSSVVPKVISIHFNASGSENAIKASMADLSKAISSAVALPVMESFESWFATRAKKEQEELMAAIERGTVSGEMTIRGTVRGRLLAKVERIDDLEKLLAESKAREAEANAREVEARAEARALQATFIEQMQLNDVHVRQKDTDSRRKDVQLQKKDARIEKLESKIEILEKKLEKCGN